MKLLEKEPSSGEVDYQGFLSIFAKGRRHADRNAIKPVTGISIQKAKQMVVEMIESKVPSGGHMRTESPPPAVLPQPCLISPGL